jgi:hypothetical protein
MEDFADTISGYTRARKISANFTESTLYDVNDDGEWTSTDAGEHYDRVEQKMKMIFRDADSGDVVTLSIPAPNDNVFDAKQEPTPDAAEAIADAYASATTSESMDLMYKGGGLISKLPKSDRRAKLYGGFAI